jgi:excisionase family DNA binding protein
MTENKVIQIQYISAETLLSSFESLIDRKLSKIQTPLLSFEPEKLLTRKDLAKFLGISEVSVWSRMKDGSIKSYKIGNLVRFKQSEILENLHQIQRKK